MLILNNSFFLTKSKKEIIQNKLQENNSDIKREIEISKIIKLLRRLCCLSPNPNKQGK